MLVSQTQNRNIELDTSIKPRNDIVNPIPTQSLPSTSPKPTFCRYRFRVTCYPTTRRCGRPGARDARGSWLPWPASKRGRTSEEHPSSLLERERETEKREREIQGRRRRAREREGEREREICVCIYIYICTYIHICTYVCVYIHLVYMHMFLYTHINMYLCIYISCRYLHAIRI